MSAISADIRTLAPGALVELYTLDATAQGGDVLQWHPHNTSAPITFGGEVYAPYPVKASGFERNTRGSLPRPRVQAGNINGALGIVLRLTGDLVGATIRRRRTFGKYLDGQPGANPAEFLPDELWIIERKVAETKEGVEFELRAAVDVIAQLPARQMVCNSCVWRYRGGDACEYSGPPLTGPDGAAFAGPLVDRGEWDDSTAYAAKDYVWRLDAEGVRVYSVAAAAVLAGTPLTDRTKWTPDVCKKSLGACKLRFGATAALPYGGFPGCDRLPRV